MRTVSLMSMEDDSSVRWTAVECYRVCMYAFFLVSGANERMTIAHSLYSSTISITQPTNHRQAWIEVAKARREHSSRDNILDRYGFRRLMGIYLFACVEKRRKTFLTTTSQRHFSFVFISCFGKTDGNASIFLHFIFTLVFTCLIWVRRLGQTSITLTQEQVVFPRNDRRVSAEASTSIFLLE